VRISWPRLVGRAGETRLLRWALDEVSAGRGATVELTGDPGIGKTRLLTELADRAGKRGIPVLSGSATEFERDLPFQVFVDALRDRYQDTAPGELGSEAAGWLAALFSGLGTPGSGAERFRVYDAVRDLLTGWARTGLVLLLDDMHWADPGAVELAEYLVRRPPSVPLLLVLAQRGRQTPARLAGTLARGVELGTVVRLEVGPLSPAESAELAGSGLDEEMQRAICAESGGNPLYLLAVAASRVAAAGAVAGSPGLATGQTAASAPNRLEAILLAELAPLTEPESLVASAGAVAGEQFSISLLRAIAGLDTPGVEAAIGGLTRRDVLRPTAAGTLSFRHPVLRRVVYGSADPAWLAAAHRRALAELARRGAAAAELAHHVAASQGGDVQRDVEILLAAAQTAMSSAPATAAHWLRVALATLPDDAAHAQQRVHVLLLLTRALGVSGRLAESRDLLHEILRLVPLRPPGPRVAAVTFCAMMERLLTRYQEARALLEAELASPRVAAAAEGAALVSEYGMVALLSADFPAARDALTSAVPQARRRGSRIDEAHLLAISALGEAQQGNIPAAIEAVDAAVALIDPASDGELSAEPKCMSALGWAELFLERYQDAERHFARGVSIIRHIGHYHVLPHLLLGQCQLAAWHGPLDRAIKLSEEAEEIARHIDSPDVLGFALGMRSFTTAWLGGPDSAKRAVDLAEQAVATIPAASVWWSRVATTFHALALLLNGDPDRCVQVAATVGGGPGLPLLQPSVRCACLDMLTAASVLSGRTDQAREFAQHAAVEARKLGLPGQRGFALRARGYLLSAQGKHAAAATTFGEAAGLLGSVGIHIGEALALASGAPSAVAAGLTETALDMIDRASTLARAFGSTTILDLAMATRAALSPGSIPGHPADLLAALTGREREIAKLAATGRTSREIAAELTLSPRTIDTHLSRIYRKLGLSSRTALATLITGGLASHAGQQG
jgi:DNA-binding CsgD family transcriptional regulator